MTPAEMDAGVRRLLDQRRAQGLPDHVEDETALRRVAAVLRNGSGAPKGAGAGIALAPLLAQGRGDAEST